jgi:autotransporter-associated beta strand protein
MKTNQPPVAFIFRSLRSVVPTLCASAILSLSASAQSVDQTWITTNPNNDWSLTAPNWNGPAPWTNNNNAIFAGTGEIVEIADNITVNNLTFNSTGFTIADANDSHLFNLLSSSVITVTTAGHIATISETISSGAITKEGAGILVLSGANTFSGNVTVNAGRLSLAHNSALGTTTGTTTVTGSGQIELTNGITITGETLNLGSGGTDFYGGLRTAENARATWAGPVIINAGARIGSLGGGILEISGPIQGGTTNNLVISATSSANGLGAVLISGTNNTYTGETTVFRGRVIIGANNALPIGTTLNLDSTTASEDSILDLNGFNQTIQALTRTGADQGDGGSIITNNGTVASRLTINQTTTASTVFSGTIQDGTASVGLTKDGASSLTLSGDNSYTGTTLLTALINNELVVAHNRALGSTAGSTTVGSGARVVLAAGIVVTGETINITGNGGNNNGALQTAANATAEWAGNIVISGGEARIGGGVGGTLIVSGVISGSTTNGLLFSRGNNSTTILNNVNTYTGDTQIFGNVAGTTARLVMGVDNAINAASRLSVIATAMTSNSIVDLNGHVLTLRGVDTTGNHASGSVLFVENNGTTPSVLTVSDTSGTSTFAGRLRDGTGVLSFVKNGNSTQTFIAPQLYTGSTTVNGGTLQLGAIAGTLGANGSLASTNIILNNGSLILDNLGTSNNSNNRLANNANITFQGGSFVYRGSELAASTETVGNLIVAPRRSTMTVTYGGTQSAAVTASQFTRAANGGSLLVNGVNLGRDASSTSSIARVFLTTAPTLIGTTDALSTGINASAKNTKIVPFLVGEATATTGGLGTATGTANTFLTYEAGTGLRPLNLADEFTLNAFTEGHNTYITSASTPTVPTSMAVNSLVINGASSVTAFTIGSGKTLTVSSGALLFTGTGVNITVGNGGTLAFGNNEGIITLNNGGNTFITSVITGTAGVSYYGTGTLVVNQQNVYTGDTGFYVGTVIPQVSTVGTPGNVTSGPFGRGRIILGGSSVRASSGANAVLDNNLLFQADTTIVSGSIDKTLTFTGSVLLNAGSRTLTNNSTTNTSFTGVISDANAGYGVTVAGTGVGNVVLSGANTYKGETALTGNTTLIINGDQSAATGIVSIRAGTLGGTGTLGGNTTIYNGGRLNPGDPAVTNGIGKLSIAQDLTLKTGSITTLDISTATFTSTDAFGGNAPGSSGYASYILEHAVGRGNHDQLGIAGSVTQETGAKINVQGVGFTPTEGQIFKLLDWSSTIGNSFSENLGSSYRDGSSDSSFDLDLPDISGSGLAWDTSFFASHGILTVIVIPEPSRAMLLVIGFAMVCLRRRR